MKKVVLSLFTILLVFALSTVAFAANSPIQEIIPDTAVTVDGEEDATTKVQVTKEQEENVFTFTAPEKDGHIFSSWEITGEYTIVTGALDEDTITIKVTDPAQTKVVADYTVEEDEEPEEKPTKPGKPGKPNDKPTSPDTGSDAIAFFGLTALIAASVAVTAKKRIK